MGRTARLIWPMTAGFVLKGEQIYFCDSNTRYHPDGDSGTVLASMTLDGGDRKVAYTIPGSLSDAGGSDRFCLLGTS